jgi:hypothetical protein
MVGRGDFKHVSEIWRTKENWEYGITGDPYERIKRAG